MKLRPSTRTVKFSAKSPLPTTSEYIEITDDATNRRPPKLRSKGVSSSKIKRKIAEKKALKRKKISTQESDYIEIVDKQGEAKGTARASSAPTSDFMVAP